MVSCIWDDFTHPLNSVIEWDAEESSYLESAFKSFFQFRRQEELKHVGVSLPSVIRVVPKIYTILINIVQSIYKPSKPPRSQVYKASDCTEKHASTRPACDGPLQKPYPRHHPHPGLVAIVNGAAAGFRLELVPVVLVRLQELAHTAGNSSRV